MRTLQAQLGLPPIEWARTTDDAWLEHFDNATIYDDLLPDDDDILRAMVKHPIMIERPIRQRKIDAFRRSPFWKKIHAFRRTPFRPSNASETLSRLNLARIA